MPRSSASSRVSAGTSEHDVVDQVGAHGQVRVGAGAVGAGPGAQVGGRGGHREPARPEPVLDRQARG